MDASRLIAEQALGLLRSRRRTREWPDLLQTGARPAVRAPRGAHLVLCRSEARRAPRRNRRTSNARRPLGAKPTHRVRRLLVASVAAVRGHPWTVPGCGLEDQTFGQALPSGRDVRRSEACRPEASRQRSGAAAAEGSEGADGQGVRSSSRIWPSVSLRDRCRCEDVPSG